MVTHKVNLITNKTNQLCTRSLLKMGSYNVAHTVLVLGQSLNLLSSILTILLTCPNNDTLLCCSNDLFLTVLLVTCLVCLLLKKEIWL